MVIERAELLVKEGLEEEFAAAMKARGIATLMSGQGCLSVKFGRGVEHPEKFILLVEWDSVDAHAAHAKTPTHATFRELIAPFVKGGSAEHFEIR